METRRQFLKKAAILSGAAGMSGAVLDSIRRAQAIDPAHGSTFWDAEHIVILMQENRSFDHAFGTLRGVRGFNDPRALTLPDGNPVWVQTNAGAASFAPFRLNIRDSNSTWAGCLPHNWTDQVDARNEGRHDRWLHVKQSGEDRYAHMPLTLGHYTRDDIPFYYQLADAFTICDQHFCSSLTGTTPNRLYLWTGTIRPQPSADAKAHVLNSDADYETMVSWTTFPERLEDLGVSWKIYQNEVWVGVGLPRDDEPWLTNFGDNPLEYFTQYNVQHIASYRQSLEARITSLTAELGNLRRDAEAANLSPSAAARLHRRIDLRAARLRAAESLRQRWSQENFDRLSPRERNIHAKAFCTNVDDPDYHRLVDLDYHDGDVPRRVRVPQGDLFHQFRRDVAEGTLPTVSWLVAPERFSDHPCSAWYGAWYIAEALNILTQNPAVWKKTIFLLTYDENDGYFDHVPPFVAPHPTRPDTGRTSAGVDAGVEYVEREQELKYKSPDNARDSPIGLGYRVPLVIASPWSRGGCVCSQVFDHTSPVQFLEKFLTRKIGKEVKESNVSAWRRTVCGDLTSAFEPYTGEAVTSPPVPPRDAFIQGIHGAQFKDPPSGYHQLSAVEIEQIRQAPLDSPWLPRQEPGVRRSCPLPYELVVDGALADDRQQFVIHFEARNSLFGPSAAGAPFIVYAYCNDGDVRARNYAVAPGDRVEDAWSLVDFRDGRYHLAIYGPNGFYREFRGGADDPDVQISLDYGLAPNAADGAKGTVEVRLANRDPCRSMDAEVSDRAYGNKPEPLQLRAGETAARAVDLQRSFGWYDLAVRVAGHDAFEKRYAGRVETGQWSFSDPAMGREAV